MFGRKAKCIVELQTDNARLAMRLAYANERANQWKNLHEKATDNASNRRTRRLRHRVDL